MRGSLESGFPLNNCVGAASDKVAALERAGVVVSDSPAKLGSLLLKVWLLLFHEEQVLSGARLCKRQVLLEGTLSLRNVFMSKLDSNETLDSLFLSASSYVSIAQDSQKIPTSTKLEVQKQGLLTSRLS